MPGSTLEHGQIVERPRSHVARWLAAQNDPALTAQFNISQRYREGFVIEHNAANTRNAGSCIFAHLWSAPDSTTAGCTRCTIGA